jgi:hypothetical protein
MRRYGGLAVPWQVAMVTLVLVSVTGVGLVRAADTQWWTSNAPADYAKAEARGVLVDTDGVLRAGPRTESFATDSLGLAWCAVMLRDGSLAVGGDRGRVLRWNEKSGWKVWARLGSGQVLSLAADGDGAVAGTGPRGLVYHIGPGGDTTRIASTGERYVWGLASAGKGAWYAATGTLGRLLRIADGKSHVLLDTEESNFVSLVPDGKGGVYVGGDSRGRVYQVRADGSSRTLFDAGEDEIRALALGPDGMVWAAGLTISAATDDPAGDDGPQPAKNPVPGGRAVLYRITPEGDGTAWWVASQPLVFSLAFANGALHAGTGNRAGLYRIERVNGASLVLAPPQGQITALVPGATGVLYAVSSNPVAVWRVGPSAGEGGELLSTVQDARRFARFGRVRAVGSGSYSFSTRTGNGDTPDTTWSHWQAVAGDGAVASPPGRFLQWKVRAGSADARVDEVSVSWRETNQAPRVEDLSVAPQGQAFREGDMSQRTESITQTLVGGQKVEYSATIGGTRPLREMPLWARGMRTLSWRGVDPNGDALRFKVAVRAEAAGDWIEIAKDLEVSVLTWNTNTLSDGRYRVKVIASDAEGNAVGEALTAEAVSEPFSIDNTPPQVSALEAKVEAAGVAVSGAAADGEGWLQRLDLSTDDGAWHSLAPDGGLSDAPRLTFHALLKELTPGPHLVSVRAVDAAGNAATRAVRVVVAGGKAPASTR